MPKCRSHPLPSSIARHTDTISDGKTPAEVAKQILQIYAILPGQKPDKQFNIPARTNTQSSAPPKETSTQQTPQSSTHESTQQAQPQAKTTPPTQEVPQLEQGVGKMNLDGPAEHEIIDRSISKGSSQSDPSNPAVTPTDKSLPEPGNPSADKKAKFTSELPPSTLLHSNPKQEARRDDLLTRKDSETQETDEFHDAQS